MFALRPSPRTSPLPLPREVRRASALRRVSGRHPFSGWSGGSQPSAALPVRSLFPGRSGGPQPFAALPVRSLVPGWSGGPQPSAALPVRSLFPREVRRASALRRVTSPLPLLREVRRASALRRVSGRHPFPGWFGGAAAPPSPIEPGDMCGGRGEIPGKASLPAGQGISSFRVLRPEAAKQTPAKPGRGWPWRGKAFPPSTCSAISGASSPASSSPSPSR